MALFNHATKELTAKIVFYGPGLCGKTTNLKILHQRLERGAGKLLSLSTAQDRTIYFDLLPIELGNIKGYTVRFQVCTVPGQVFYNETRRIVLRGVDGLVFVVDSQWSMLSHNLESFQNLRENLADEKIPLESLPVVIQYNKRDLPSALSVEALQESLGFQPRWRRRRRSTNVSLDASLKVSRTPIPSEATASTYGYDWKPSDS